VLALFNSAQSGNHNVAFPTRRRPIHRDGFGRPTSRPGKPKPVRISAADGLRRLVRWPLRRGRIRVCSSS